MLRDNLLSLSVDFLRQDIVDLVSYLCGIAFILLFILLLLRFYATLFYLFYALSMLSLLYCVYDFTIINRHASPSLTLSIPDFVAILIGHITLHILMIVSNSPSVCLSVLQVQAPNLKTKKTGNQTWHIGISVAQEVTHHSSDVRNIQKIMTDIINHAPSIRFTAGVLPFGS